MAEPDHEWTTRSLGPGEDCCDIAGYLHPDRKDLEIRRLRAALEEIAEWDIATNAQWSASAEQMQRVARAALGAMSMTDAEFLTAYHTWASHSRQDAEALASAITLEDGSHPVAVGLPFTDQTVYCLMLPRAAEALKGHFPELRDVP